MYLSTLACIMTLALGLLVVPRTTGAQPLAKIPRLGYLTDSARRAESKALRQALREIGYVEGQTIAFEWRFVEQPEQYPDRAAELVRLKVDVIVAGGATAIRAAQHATRTIPIVMAGTADPVGAGFVASLAHPGGNITGLSGLGAELPGSGWRSSRRRCPRARASPCWRIQMPHTMSLR